MVFGDVLLQYALRVLFRLARVDRERLAEADGMFKLADEDFLLQVARGVVVVIVKPHFAPADATRMRHCFYSVDADRGLADVGLSERKAAAYIFCSISSV